MFAIYEYLWCVSIITSCIMTLHAYCIGLTISKTNGIHICSILQIMASMCRNTIWTSFVQIPTQLRDLVSKVPDTSSFDRRHGHLLSLVTSKLDEQMMSVLVQFFDPLYHCFTFPDYQLVPTLEEFSDLLGISILEQTPFTGGESP